MFYAIYGYLDTLHEWGCSNTKSRMANEFDIQYDNRTDKSLGSITCSLADPLFIVQVVRNRNLCYL